LDAAECPPTFHTPPDRVVALIAGGSQAIVQAVEGAEDDAGQGRADLEARRIGAADAVVGISASGRTPYVVGALQQARTAGAFTVGIACNAATPVLAAGDVAIPLVVGPEVLAGSTRLKSGTATKMVLNMLSTGAFVQLGKCYQNLMVDVQAGNEKLRQRARRIVEQATGLGPAAARALLERSGGDVKTAIVMQRCGIDAAAARARLQAAGGFVRAAIGEGERA
jgi:N-acetylmuramic acid 6-phosphate etherase